MNTTSLRFVVAGLALASVVVACSSSSDSTPDPGPNGTTDNPSDPTDPKTPGADAATPTDGAAADPLTCLSHTWCGSGSVTQWNGQVLPTTRGGTIPDGLYRLAFMLAEKGTGTQFGGYEEGLQIRKGSIRTFGGLSKVGTFTSADGKLDVTYATYCDDGSGATGDTLDADHAKEETEYLVDAEGRLMRFFQSSGSAGKQTVAHVYLPQATFCGNLPKSVPTMPGDSFVCKVTNCGCTEATNGPANAQTCKFVHGGG